MSRERPNPELERMVNVKRARIDNPPDTREGLYLLAKLACASNRYEHMFQYMKRLVGIVAPGMALSDSERQCFYSACTSLVQGQLDSYRYVTKAMVNSVAVDQWRADAAIEYLQLMALEICKLCSDIIEVIDHCLLRTSYSLISAEAAAESRVFYKKMKGDFLKYMIEVKKGAEKERLVTDTFGAYMSTKYDIEVLPATNPTRLELKLSLALFYFEIRAWPSIARNVASEAFDLATQEIEGTGEIATEETATVLRRLRSLMETLKR